MKRRLVSAIGVLALAAALLGVLYEPPFVASVSRQTYDILLRRAARPPRSGAIVMVDIDEASLKAMGQWPWPRAVLADLTGRLWSNGAAVIVFDVVFPEPDRMSPRAAEQEWRKAFGPGVSVRGLPAGARDFDEVFAASLRGGSAVLGSYLELSGLLWEESEDDSLYRGRWFEIGESQRRFLPQARRIVHSLPVLRAAATEAFFNTAPDTDNIIRKTPLVFQAGPDRIYPALSLEAVRLYLGVDTFGIEYDSEVGQGVRAIRLGELSIPTDANGSLVLNFRSKAFASVSAMDVASGAVGPEAVSNRIVLIGASAAGLRDLKATPVSAEIPGIEVHATAMDNILAGDMLRQPRWMLHATLAITLAAGVVLILVIARSRAWTGFVVAAAFLAMAVAGSWSLLVRWRFVVLPTGVVLATTGIYTLMTVVKFWQEERDRRRLRSMFGPMVSNDVLEYMEQHPGSFSLAGRKVEATVFFSDISNFTGIAEGVDPHVLTRVMNRYLTPMADIVMQRGGYVDKFNGDAIMAVWGALLAEPDHAARACLAALDQLERLETLRDEIRKEFGPELRIRIGISTGEVVAGNMGSERRFQYTVMGDPVNQASRFLQDASKAFGTQVILSESTFLQARGEVVARCLGAVRVRGKTQPVRIYELVGRKGGVDAGRLRLIERYAEALACFEKGEGPSCVGKLEALLRDFPDDGPSRCLLARAKKPAADAVIDL